MATEYKMRIYDTLGALQYEVDDFQALVYGLEVNAVGMCRFSLSGNHALVGELADKWLIEVWRRNKVLGIDWMCDWSGLYRDSEQRGVMPGVFVGMAASDAVRLGWRVVAWPAGTLHRTKFVGTAAETIAKTLVGYNVGSMATVGNGRLRDGTIAGVGVAADLAQGNTLDFVCFGQNVLAALQGIAAVGGGDFELAKTGAATWDFRWHAGQLGSDRTGSVVFAVGYDNMSNPQFVTDRGAAKSVAIVAGQGQGDGRMFVVRTGADYTAIHDIEVFVDARDIAAGDVAAMNSRGDQVLDELRLRDTFEFSVQQTYALAYGRDYALGDLVTAVSPFSGQPATKKIQRITVSVSNGQEDIGVILQDV